MGSLGRELGYYKAWSFIVTEYTSWKLTNPSDKLVAISGLARCMHAGLGGKVNYAAGLWDHYLFLQLLWTLQNGSSPALKYRAPSWSWAYVDGRVHNSWTSDDSMKESSTAHH